MKNKISRFRFYNEFKKTMLNKQVTDLSYNTSSLQIHVQFESRCSVDVHFIPHHLALLKTTYIPALI